MGSTERRAKEKSEVRGRILDAARELFARDGYEAVTMRRIAERIEYTSPAIYFHFKDKLELLQAICREDFANLASRLVSFVGVGDPWETLARVGRAYVEFAIQNPNHYRLLFMTKHPPDVEMEDDGDQGVPARDAYAMVRGLSADAIAKGCIKPEYTDPELVAQLLWSALHGVASLSITMCDTRGIELRPIGTLTDSMIDTLMRGMASPDVPALPRAKKPSVSTQKKKTTTSSKKHGR